MATDEAYSAIFRNRHPVLEQKLEAWTLIYNSYLGGTNYLNGKYLVKYPKESPGSFAQRKKRAVYFNQVSPLVDMLSGLLFLNLPTRTMPKDIRYLQDNFSGKKGINEFMRVFAAHTLMFTCAVLVDSPNFSYEKIKTKRDRLKSKVNPYAVMYLPFKIIDFDTNNDDGLLNWIILDDSYYEHTDPFSDGKIVDRHRLWTRTFHQDFTKRDKGAITAGPKVSHPVGEVPVKLVAWRDDNNDFVAESIFEDISMITKLIYNNMSYMDEMLASGTFKILVYPSKSGTLPAEVKAGGIGPMSAMGYDGNFSTAPSFIGAQLEEIDPFIKAIGFYMAEVLKKIGLSTDETKEFVKSGVAKKIDFQKMRALLESGAQAMAETEKWIFFTAAKWEKKILKPGTYNSIYNSGFSDEDLQTEVSMLTELLIQPVKRLQVEVLKIITKKLLRNNVKPEVLEEITKDIDASFDGSGKPVIDIKKMAVEEAKAISLKKA